MVGLDRAEASVETPYGLATIGWALGPDGLRVELGIPVGTSATLDLPVSPDSIVTGDGRPLGATVIDAGRHHLLVDKSADVAHGEGAVTAATAQPASAGADGTIEAG